MELTLSQSHLHCENAVQLSAAEAIHTVPIFIPSGINDCWVDKGSVVSKLSQIFYTSPELRESNPRSIDLGTSALTIRPCVPIAYGAISKSNESIIKR